MGLLCNPCGRRTACGKTCRDPEKEKVNGNSCPCQCENEDAAVETTQVRALLNYVLDSCCTTEDVCREITLDCPMIFDPEELCVGQPLDVELAGDIVFKEIKRSKDDCACLSSVRFSIPVRIYGTAGNCCGRKYIEKDICVVRTVKLCCTGDSQLTAYNSKVVAVSAIVNNIDCNEITICLCLLFRSCLQQTALREFSFEATPVCSWAECGDARRRLIDQCDTLCGCAENAKACPSCS